MPPSMNPVRQRDHHSQVPHASDRCFTRGPTHMEGDLVYAPSRPPLSASINGDDLFDTAEDMAMWEKLLPCPSTPEGAEAWRHWRLGQRELLGDLGIGGHPVYFSGSEETYGAKETFFTTGAHVQHLQRILSERWHVLSFIDMAQAVPPRVQAQIGEILLGGNNSASFGLPPSAQSSVHASGSPCSVNTTPCAAALDESFFGHHSGGFPAARTASPLAAATQKYSTREHRHEHFQRRRCGDDTAAREEHIAHLLAKVPPRFFRDTCPDGAPEETGADRRDSQRTRFAHPETADGVIGARPTRAAAAGGANVSHASTNDSQSSTNDTAVESSLRDVALALRRAPHLLEAGTIADRVEAMVEARGARRMRKSLEFRESRARGQLRTREAALRAGIKADLANLLETHAAVAAATVVEVVMAEAEEGSCGEAASKVDEHDAMNIDMAAKALCVSSAPLPLTPDLHAQLPHRELPLSPFAALPPTDTALESVALSARIHEASILGAPAAEDQSLAQHLSKLTENTRDASLQSTASAGKEGRSHTKKQKSGKVSGTAAPPSQMTGGTAAAAAPVRLAKRRKLKQRGANRAPHRRRGLRSDLADDALLAEAMREATAAAVAAAAADSDDAHRGSHVRLSRERTPSKWPTDELVDDGSALRGDSPLSSQGDASFLAFSEQYCGDAMPQTLAGNRMSAPVSSADETLPALAALVPEVRAAIKEVLCSKDLQQLSDFFAGRATVASVLSSFVRCQDMGVRAVRSFAPTLSSFTTLLLERCTESTGMSSPFWRSDSALQDLITIIDLLARCLTSVLAVSNDECQALWKVVKSAPHVQQRKKNERGCREQLAVLVADRNMWATQLLRSQKLQLQTSTLALHVLRARQMTSNTGVTSTANAALLLQRAALYVTKRSNIAHRVLESFADNELQPLACELLFQPLFGPRIDASQAAAPRTHTALQQLQHNFHIELGCSATALFAESVAALLGPSASRCIARCAVGLMTTVRDRDGGAPNGDGGRRLHEYGDDDFESSDGEDEKARLLHTRESAVATSRGTSVSGERALAVNVGSVVGMAIFRDGLFQRHFEDFLHLLVRVSCCPLLITDFGVVAVDAMERLLVSVSQILFAVGNAIACDALWLDQLEDSKEWVATNSALGVATFVVAACSACTLLCAGRWPQCASTSTSVKLALKASRESLCLCLDVLPNLQDYNAELESFSRACCAAFDAIGGSQEEIVRLSFAAYHRFLELAAILRPQFSSDARLHVEAHSDGTYLSEGAVADHTESALLAAMRAAADRSKSPKSPTPQQRDASAASPQRSLHHFNLALAVREAEALREQVRVQRSALAADSLAMRVDTHDGRDDQCADRGALLTDCPLTNSWRHRVADELQHIFRAACCSADHSSEPNRCEDVSATRDDHVGEDREQDARPFFSLSNSRTPDDGTAAPLIGVCNVCRPDRAVALSEDDRGDVAEGTKAEQVAELLAQLATISTSGDDIDGSSDV